MSITFSTSLQKLISSTADRVVEQLMPNVVCLDYEGNVSKYLKREVTWMEVIRTEQELAEIEGIAILIIVTKSTDRVPSSALAMDAHRIFCIEDGSNHPIDHQAQSIAVKLNAPSIETVLFHIKAVLLISNCVFRYHSHHPIYRYSARNDTALMSMVDKIFQRETVYILLDALEESNSWYDFLFETLDKRLRPKKVSAIPTIGQSSYFCISTSDFTQLPQQVSNNRFIAFTDDIKLTEHSEFIDLRRNQYDAESEFTKHYLAAASASLELDSIKYFTDDHKALNFSLLKSSILTAKSTSNDAPNDLVDFLESHKTLSLPNFMEELEYQILSGLRRKSDRVKGTVNASGIKAVTLHKKMERHHLKKYSEKPD